MGHPAQNDAPALVCCVVRGVCGVSQVYVEPVAVWSVQVHTECDRQRKPYAVGSQSRSYEYLPSSPPPASTSDPEGGVGVDGNIHTNWLDWIRLESARLELNRRRGRGRWRGVERAFTAADGPHDHRDHQKRRGQPSSRKAANGEEHNVLVRVHNLAYVNARMLALWAGHQAY